MELEGIVYNMTQLTSKAFYYDYEEVIKICILV